MTDRKPSPIAGAFINFLESQGFKLVDCTPVNAVRVETPIDKLKKEVAELLKTRFTLLDRPVWHCDLSQTHPFAFGNDVYGRGLYARVSVKRKNVFVEFVSADYCHKWRIHCKKTTEHLKNFLRRL